MYDTQRVHVPYTHNHLLDDKRCLLFIQVLVFSHKLKQIFAWTQFCDNVNVSFGLETAFELDQKWVAENLHDAAFMAFYYEKNTQSFCEQHSRALCTQ